MISIVLEKKSRKVQFTAEISRSGYNGIKVISIYQHNVEILSVFEETVDPSICN